MTERKRRGDKSEERDGLSLHPLTLEQALAGAMATGAPPPGPKRKRDQEKKQPPAKRGRKPGPAKRE